MIKINRDKHERITLINENGNAKRIITNRKKEQRMT